MNQFSELLGGSLPGDLTDLMTKFDQGNHAQVPDQQVDQMYGQVATQLPQDQYVQAAEAAFAKLSPQQRTEFASLLQAKAQQFGLPAAPQGSTADPAELATAVGQVHAQEPGLLQKMFAPDGIFSNPIAKAVLLGVTAMAAQRLTGSGR